MKIKNSVLSVALTTSLALISTCSFAISDDLIIQISEDTGVSKKVAESIVKSAVKEITKSVANGEKVVISNLGVFSLAQRGARKGRNPQTGETINIPAKKTVKFVPAKQLNQAIQ
jgi:DNA-binding protein HU-beta